MNGIVPLLKPPGMTSSNAVYDVRRILGEKHAGHLGTLDPGASGVLPVCLGRATRLFDYLVDKDKEYVFEASFGQATDTQDAFGVVTEECSCDITRRDIERVLPQFRGTIPQTAPIYSALKVDGEKMYDLAREGRAVEPRVREIRVHSLELMEQTSKNRFLLRIRCSRGTYVRTVCFDLGRALGVCAHMSFLLRTASGPFTLERSVTVPELEALQAENRAAAAILSCEEALSFLPAVTLAPERRQATVNALETNLRWPKNELVRVYCDGFLGIGEIRDSRIKLAVHLY